MQKLFWFCSFNGRRNRGHSDESSLEHAAQSFCTMICGLTVHDSGTEKFLHTLLFTFFHFDFLSSAATILTFQLAPLTQQKFPDVS
jgi:hypothetical protein